MTTKKILVPIDGTERSMHSLNFIKENYSPEKATIGIVVLTKDSEGKNTGFKILMTVVWEDNDWKVDNNNAENATPLTKEPTYICKAQGGSQSS